MAEGGDQATSLVWPPLWRAESPEGEEVQRAAGLWWLQTGFKMLGGCCRAAPGLHSLSWGLRKALRGQQQGAASSGVCGL